MVRVFMPYHHAYQKIKQAESENQNFQKSTDLPSVKFNIKPRS